VMGMFQLESTWRVILGRYQSFCLVLLHLSAYQCFVMRREDLIKALLQLAGLEAWSNGRLDRMMVARGKKEKLI
jgi:hypothetical protein